MRRCKGLAAFLRVFGPSRATATHLRCWGATMILWITWDALVARVLAFHLPDVTWFLHHLRQRPDLGMWLAARHDAALRRQLPHAASSLGWEHFVQWLKGLAAQRSLALPTWPSEPPPEATGLFQLEWSLAAAPPEAASAATFGSCATLRAATYRLLHHHALAPQRKQTLAAAAAMYRPQAGMNVAGMLRRGK